MKLRSLGLLKKYEDPYFRHFEHQFLLSVRRALTVDWGIIQSGQDDRTLGK